MKNYFLIFLAAFMMASASLFSQGERKDKTAVTYEELYDEPYSVNKLFIGFQPLYGELFMTNVNAGFGMEASYYHKDKVDFKAHFRKSYSQGFYDFNRDLASKNSQVDNRAEIYNYFEFGGTYHIKDFESSSKTKMILYKNSYQGNKWAARVPLNAVIPCKVRKIYGARLGGIIWDSTLDLNRIMDDQGLTNADLKDSEGNGLPMSYNNGQKDVPIDVFSNISTVGGYVGGSITWIKNVAVDFDKFEEGIDDLIFTAFFDILVSPSMKIDDVVYTDRDVNSTSPMLTRTYSIDPIKTKMFGFRLGMEGKFNRTLSWSYGGEVGYRPSIDGRGFFALFKISFPVYGTNLDYKVESFGK
ncbi:MAG: hypothetical protein JNM57_03815 [Cyclobacteriaceae bacterium]|nr:hypothetical protein [Cyclobacteriaceae bacterium]